MLKRPAMLKQAGMPKRPAMLKRPAMGKQAGMPKRPAILKRPAMGKPLSAGVICHDPSAMAKRPAMKRPAGEATAAPQESSSAKRPRNSCLFDFEGCHYNALGIRRGAPHDEVRRSYYARALTAHPDRGGTPAFFQSVNNAFKVLCNKELRALYDAQLKQTFSPDGAGTAPLVNNVLDPDGDKAAVLLGKARLRVEELLLESNSMDPPPSNNDNKLGFWTDRDISTRLMAGVGGYKFASGTLDS